MLKAILKIMKNSNEFSSSTIAKELNISETMVEIYKEQLEQKGYIKINAHHVDVVVGVLKV